MRSVAFSWSRSEPESKKKLTTCSRASFTVTASSASACPPAVARTVVVPALSPPTTMPSCVVPTVAIAGSATSKLTSDSAGSRTTFTRRRVVVPTTSDGGEVDASKPMKRWSGDSSKRAAVAATPDSPGTWLETVPPGSNMSKCAIVFAPAMPPMCSQSCPAGHGWPASTWNSIAACCVSRP